jgi:hypothetical protein
MGNGIVAKQTTKILCLLNDVLYIFRLKLCVNISFFPKCCVTFLSYSSLFMRCYAKIHVLQSYILFLLALSLPP